MRRRHSLTVAALLLAGFHSRLAAQTFSEPGEATDNVLAPVQTPAGALTEIHGAIVSAPEADAYAIRIVDPESFEASTDGNESDTQLWIFTVEGRLVDWSDDIDEQNLASRLTGSNITEPGLYILAITEYCYEPVDEEGNALISTQTPFAAWSTAGKVGMCGDGSSKAAPGIKTGGTLDLGYVIGLTGVRGSMPSLPVSAGDSLALVALYEATNGPGWTNSANWLLGDVALWYGIAVAAGRVMGIDLSDNNLTGGIPAALGNLQDLEELVLGDNGLTGTVPDAIGDLSRLRRLEFHQNTIAGPMPLSLTRLPALERFWFDETGVCVPAEEAFQQWLAGIEDVRGTGVVCAPVLGLAPTALEFGPVAVGGSSDLSVTMTNSGSAAAGVTVSVSEDFGTGGFSFVDGIDGFSLEPGAVREIVVRFAPDEAGASTSAILFAYEGGGSIGELSLPLSGTGIAPSIVISAPELAFGEVTVGAVRELALSISNSGNGPLVGSVLGGTGFADDGFAFKSGEGDFSLDPEASRTVTVSFRPTKAGGVTVALYVSHNDPAQTDPIAVSVSGTGMLPPAPFVFVEPAAIDFGDVVVGATVERTLTISNLGPGLLQGSIAVGLGWQSAGFVLAEGGGAFALSSGESRSIVLRMNPASVGSKASSLSISHGASNEPSPIRVTVVGNAVPADTDISVIPSLVEFGSVTLGSTVERSLVVRHTGSGGRLVGSVDEFGDLASKGIRVVSGPGAFDLGAGEQWEARLSFAPERPGFVASEVKVTHNVPNRGVAILVPVVGEGIEPVNPAIEVMPAGLTFGDVSVEAALDLSVLVRNVGSGSLSGEVMVPVPPTRFSVRGGGGVFDLAPGESRAVHVRFEPTVLGVAASSVQIVHGAPGTGSPLVVPLIGNGTAQNAAPVAAPDSVATPPGTPVTIAVLANDLDPNGDAIRLVGLMAAPLKGVATPQDDGTIVYTPLTSFAGGFDTFQYRMTDGTFTAVGTAVVRMVTGVPTEIEKLPSAFALEQNYPNPFGAVTWIRYSLEGPGRVTLRVYDGVGRMVDTLVDRVQSAGAYETQFVATGLPSGSYYTVLEKDGVRRVKALTLLR